MVILHGAVFCYRSMTPMLDFIARNSGALTIGIGCLTIALAAMLISTNLQLRKFRKKWQALMEGTGSDSLERLLYDHLRERVLVEQHLEEAVARVKTLETKMSHSKRFVGLVRFDAFEDVGGSQSFSLAVYDEDGNGFVLSSLVGRVDCRVYCKELVGGHAGRHLSTEEEQAIELAAANRSKPRVTT
jgi:hypothetical protein